MIVEEDYSSQESLSASQTAPDEITESGIIIEEDYLSQEPLSGSQTIMEDITEMEILEEEKHTQSESGDNHLSLDCSTNSFLVNKTTTRTQVEKLDISTNSDNHKPGTVNSLPRTGDKTSQLTVRLGILLTGIGYILTSLGKKNLKD